VTQPNRTPLIPWIGRLPGELRNRSALVPAALALLVVLAGGILLASVGLQRSNAAKNSHAGAKTMLLARADVHTESLYNGEDLELNLSISQVGNDCQAALNGGVCLRYSVVLEEKPIVAGYGVIPLSAVHITPTNIILNVDTTQVPDFVNVVGSGGRIVMTWKNSVTTVKPDTVHSASVAGNIGAYALPAKGIIASMLFH
jgi:hypothetical protein